MILGADGQTAKTYVPIRSRLGVTTTGEQHWGRTANGWGITTERERGTIAGVRTTLNVNVHLDDAEV